jgi:hypothetical protein
MSQVTIYLEEDALAAAKIAATRAQVSVSKWFAQFAEAEKTKLTSDRTHFWAEIDRLRNPASDEELDFLLDPKRRYADLGPDRRLESFGN